MTRSVHLFVFDGYADWEAAYATAGIQNPAFQRRPGQWRVRTVGTNRKPVRSMGGLAVQPDEALADLDAGVSRLLILPGGHGWEQEGAYQDAVAKAVDLIAHDVPVAAICGATAGLAKAGLLDQRAHTSNAASYLNGTGYGGSAHYQDEPAVTADGVITAGGMAPLEFAREIFQLLSIYDDETLDAWYQLNKTGHSRFYARMARASASAAEAP